VIETKFPNVNLIRQWQNPSTVQHIVNVVTIANVKYLKYCSVPAKLNSIEVRFRQSKRFETIQQYIGKQNVRVRCIMTMSNATPPNLPYSMLKALNNFMCLVCIHNLRLLPELMSTPSYDIFSTKGKVILLDAIRDFSAFDDIAGFTVSEQDTLVTSLIRQHVLYRSLLFVIYFILQCYVSVCFVAPYAS